MGKLNKDNLRKTIYYLKKNGLKNTMYAVAERLQKKESDSYTYVAPEEAVLEAQREVKWENSVTFSILVPLYHTPKKYLAELIESVRSQTYPHFQLILLDASEEKEKSTALEKQVSDYDDSRIQYHKLAENRGIAENTNAGLEYVTGDYIALLDHDDLLTADALYEFAVAIRDGKKQGVELQMLYSDEDKCNGEAEEYYEPHYKKDFDLDLLLTNNYICHFTAVKAEVFKELKLRGLFNGAQDFDLVLRVAGKFINDLQVICHVPKILYHWRCHMSSTAANPASKMYAYEAGKKAVEAFVEERGWKAKVEHLKHLGFYQVLYEESFFAQRADVGAIGGSLLDKSGKITGGMCDASGKVVYEGLRKGFSGYMNRAVLSQQAEVLDIRCMQINPACEAIFEKSLKEMNLTLDEYKEIEDNNQLTNKEIDMAAVSMKVSKDLQEAGYRLVWKPEWIKKL